MVTDDFVKCANLSEVKLLHKAQNKEKIRTEIKKITSKGIDESLKIILQDKDRQIKKIDYNLRLLQLRRALLRRLADSIAWQFFGRIVVMNTQRENIDFISDKIGLEYEKDFFNKKAKEQQDKDIVVPVFNDITNCLSIGDVSVVTIQKNKILNDFYEMKSSEIGGYTPRAIKQSNKGEIKTDYFEEGRGNPLGKQEKSQYQSHVISKYNWYDIQDLLVKCKKKGISARIRDKCLLYIANDPKQVSTEDVIGKKVVPYMKKRDGRIGTLETNIRIPYLKPIFLFEIDKNLILDIIFGRLEFHIILSYFDLNKMTYKSSIEFSSEKGKGLHVFSKVDKTTKIRLEGTLLGEVIYGGLSIKSFIEYLDEMIPRWKKIREGLPKNHPLSPFDPSEKYGFQIVKGKIQQ